MPLKDILHGYDYIQNSLLLIVPKLWKLQGGRMLYMVHAFFLDKKSEVIGIAGSKFERIEQLRRYCDRKKPIVIAQIGESEDDKYLQIIIETKLGVRVIRWTIKREGSYNKLQGPQIFDGEDVHIPAHLTDLLLDIPS